MCFSLRLYCTFIINPKNNRIESNRIIYMVLVDIPRRLKKCNGSPIHSHHHNRNTMHVKEMRFVVVKSFYDTEKKVHILSQFTTLVTSLKNAAIHTPCTNNLNNLANKLKRETYAPCQWTVVATRCCSPSSGCNK